MNPTTKTALLPEGILAVIRAENSPNIKMLMDMRAKRDDSWLNEWNFPWALDADGNRFIDTNHYCVQGVVIWAVWVQKLFWSQVAKGELSINPRALFRLPDAQPRILETLAAQL